MFRKETRTVRTLIALHLLLLVYSFSGFFSKNAAAQDFLSLPFILLYGSVLFILGVYAIGWQQIIKHLSLTVAFANKAITVVWGIVWGFLFFAEAITAFKIIGAILIIVGIVIFSIEDQKTAQEKVIEAIDEAHLEPHEVEVYHGSAETQGDK